MFMVKNLGSLDKKKEKKFMGVSNPHDGPPWSHFPVFTHSPTRTTVGLCDQQNAAEVTSS